MDSRYLTVGLLGLMEFGNRLSLYTDLVTVSGIFLGFSATGLAAYLALSGPSIDRLREVANGMILKQWLAAIRGSGLVVFIVLSCKAADRETGMDVVHWIATAAAILLGFRAIRMIYVFARLSEAATGPAFERSRSERRNHLRKAG